MTKKAHDTAEKPDYPSITGAATMILTIEYVYAISDICDAENVLENLCSYGSAKVIKRTMSTASFDDACKILDKRAID